MATGSKIQTKPRWITAALGTALGVALTAGGLLSVAFAVSFSNPFELDGDIADGAAAGTDWVTEYNNGNLNPPGGVFIEDVTADRIFTGGSTKDELPIEGWKSRSGSPPAKDDILNAYAVSKVDPTNNHTLIYFGADRFDSSGSAQMGFWFFENENLTDGNNFTGSHSDNDLLVLLEYSNGGTTGSVKVFHWSQALFDDGNSQTSPLVLIGSGSGTTVICNTTGPKPPNSACITNNTGNLSPPWPYTPKGTPAGTIPPRQFIEGVVDVTALVGDVCISSFMAETRSSFETNSVLKDFALGDINTCSVTVAKTCDGNTKAFLPADNLYSTEHEITLINNGGGKIFDVEFKDNVISDDPTQLVACDIIKIGNTDFDPGLAIANATDWNPVDSENITIDLEANTSIKVRLLCLSSINGFKNSVTVRARSAGGSLIAANADDTVSETDDDSTACTVDVPAAINILKDCKVSIDATSLKPRVCASVAVSNPSGPLSNQFLTVSSIKNYPGLKSLPDPADPPAGGVDIKAAFTAANGGSSVLALDQTVNFTFCYDPVAADSVPSPVFPPLPDPVLPTTLLNQFAPFLDPGVVAFSDTVQVIATGNATGTSVRDDDAATCPLCPTCPDCPPE